MAAGFAALCNQRRGAAAGQQLGHCHRRHHRDHLDAGGQPFFHIFARIAGAGHHDLDAFLDDHVGHLVGKGAHQHYINAKNPIRQLTGFGDLFPKPLGVCVHRGDDAQAPCVGDRRRQGCIGNPCHAALKNGILDSQ